MASMAGLLVVTLSCQITFISSVGQNVMERVYLNLWDFWKSYTSRKVNVLGSPRSTPAATTLWQREFFDHILRSEESYSQKWNYVRDNPVRAGLVRSADAWKYAGEIETLMLQPRALAAAAPDFAVHRTHRGQRPRLQRRSNPKSLLAVSNASSFVQS